MFLILPQIIIGSQIGAAAKIDLTLIGISYESKKISHL